MRGIENELRKVIKMNENQVSNTALWTAYMRAYHTRNAADKIFDDFLAYDLVPRDIREEIEQQIIPEIFCQEPTVLSAVHDTLRITWKKLSDKE